MLIYKVLSWVSGVGCPVSGVGCPKSGVGNRMMGCQVLGTGMLD